jgi:hypothetical protein
MDVPWAASAVLAAKQSHPTCAMLMPAAAAAPAGPPATIVVTARYLLAYSYDCDMLFSDCLLAEAVHTAIRSLQSTMADFTAEVIGSTGSYCEKCRAAGALVQHAAGALFELSVKRARVSCHGGSWKLPGSPLSLLLRAATHKEHQQLQGMTQPVCRTTPAPAPAAIPRLSRLSVCLSASSVLRGCFCLVPQPAMDLLGDRLWYRQAYHAQRPDACARLADTPTVVAPSKPTAPAGSPHKLYAQGVLPPSQAAPAHSSCRSVCFGGLCCCVAAQHCRLHIAQSRLVCPSTPPLPTPCQARPCTGSPER